MAKFYWSLQCEVHGTLNGVAFPALVTSDVNTPPAAACPIDAAHKVAPGSMRFLSTDNPPFSKSVLVKQTNPRLAIASDVFVSDVDGKSDFMFSTNVLPLGAKLRIGAFAKRNLGTTITSVGIRVVRVNLDDSDGSVVNGSEFSIPTPTDNISAWSTGAFVPDAGFKLYRLQYKVAGGQPSEQAVVLTYGIVVITP